MAQNERFLIFIPCYRCENQVSRTLAQLSKATALNCEALVLDNRSPDGTIEAAISASDKLSIPVRVARNDENYGLGGSHKAAFDYAMEHGFDYLIVLHGDDQGNIADLLPMIAQGKHRDVDCLLGARFMKGARLQGYSAFRTFGNRVFNLLFSAVAGQRLYDLGAGLNLYKVESLRKAKWRYFGNDLTFNYYMILGSAAWRWSLRFFPISWREDDQLSNVKLFRQARRTIGLLLEFAIARKSFLAKNHSGRESGQYTSTIVHSNRAARGFNNAPML
ncbi:glycosyltransferase [Achromobacter xylosoxidans]|nr:glycosyltransferase [Achromobacter xylosoxidans]